MKTLIFSDDGEIAGQISSYLKEGLENNIVTFPGEENKCGKTGAKTLYVIGGQADASNVSIALKDLKEQESIDFVFIGSTAFGRDVAGKLAGLGNFSPLSEITSIEFKDGKATTTRFLYGGKSVLTEESSSNLFVTAPGISEVLQNQADSPVKPISLKAPAVKINSEEQKSTGGVDLEKAKIIVSIGRGLGKPDGIQLIEQFAKAVKGEIAGSRPVCLDYHWLSEDRQVGLSGKKVRPKLYIAVGISGQIQHIAGMRGAKTVIAINKDKTAPIFEECDYGLIGDLYQIVPKLISSLST